ncbi:MAG: divergent polysaccharide deacetylase family protein [Xanthobacteraceae bacterium]
MTADDLSVPLGQQQKARRHTIRIPVPQIIAGALALFLALFVLWAVIGDDPFGGEPMVVVPAHLLPATAANTSDTPGPHEAAGGLAGPGRYDGPAAPPPPYPPPQAGEGREGGAPPGTRTVTIIDGKTGARQEVVIPAPGNGSAPSDGAPIDQKFVEMTPHGLIPKIAADGVRPADAFAQPVKELPGKPDAPRVALIVGALGVSTKATSDAIAKLPGPVTLAFMPYGSDVLALVARARGEGHEVLLQVPMEPFDYPDNDPGPQTLLTSLAPQQNIDRLYWLMSRIQGYVGIINMMGGRFTASEQSFAPVLRETAKRGLIFVDDGSNARSVAGRIAGANNVPFAKADVVLDSVPTPGEIDRALGRLEMAARERSVAVGISSALPVSIAHIAKWAKAAESRGLLLVPITAVAVKAKQS